MNEIPDQTLTEISEAIFSGRKIEAIKRYRTATGVGLKEAKESIEEIEASLRAKSPERFSPGAKGSGCLGAAAVIVICGFVVLRLTYLA